LKVGEIIEEVIDSLTFFPLNRVSWVGISRFFPVGRNPTGSFGTFLKVEITYDSSRKWLRDRIRN
jgi:hypothetical protein